MSEKRTDNLCGFDKLGDRKDIKLLKFGKVIISDELLRQIQEPVAKEETCLQPPTSK